MKKDPTQRSACTTLNLGNTHLSLAEWSQAPTPIRTQKTAADERALAVLIRSINTKIPLVVAGVVPKLKTRLLNALKRKKIIVRVFRADLRPDIEIVPQPPERVGDDRIAGALGALAINPRVPWIVADVGSAVTCNAVLPGQGRPPRFEGGLIVPGAAMSLKALAQHTAQLPQLDEADLGEFQFIGHSTDEAIRWGVSVVQISGLLAMIEGQRRTLGAQAQVVLTGGGAPALRDAMKFAAPAPVEFTYHPWLVHLGLFETWRQASGACQPIGGTRRRD